MQRMCLSGMGDRLPTFLEDTSAAHEPTCSNLGTPVKGSVLLQQHSQWHRPCQIGVALYVLTL